MDAPDHLEHRITDSSRARFEGARFLLVDDDDAVLEAVSATVQRQGGRAEIASSLQDAARILGGASPPHAAVLDLALPGAWGLELSPLLVATRCPFVVLSAYSAQHVEGCLRSGAWDVLVKPATAIEILAALSGALKRSHFLRARFPRTASLERDVATPSERRHSPADALDLHLDHSMRPGRTGCMHEHPALASVCERIRTRRGLTLAEGRVMCAMTFGLTEPMLSQRLDLKLHTTRKHTASVRGKLGVRNNRSIVEIFFDEFSHLFPSTAPPRRRAR